MTKKVRLQRDGEGGYRTRDGRWDVWRRLVGGVSLSDLRADGPVRYGRAPSVWTLSDNSGGEKDRSFETLAEVREYLAQRGA